MSREAFEVWYTKVYWNMKLGGVVFVDNKYTHSTVQLAWDSWQAAQAEMQDDLKNLNDFNEDYKRTILKLETKIGLVQLGWDNCETQKEEIEAVAKVRNEWCAEYTRVRNELLERDAVIEQMHEFVEAAINIGNEFGCLDLNYAEAYLALTPSEALAKHDAEVAAQGWQAACEYQRESDAGICDRFAEREMHPAECADAIRANKGE